MLFKSRAPHGRPALFREAPPSSSAPYADMEDWISTSELSTA